MCMIPPPMRYQYSQTHSELWNADRQGLEGGNKMKSSSFNGKTISVLQDEKSYGY